MRSIMLRAIFSTSSPSANSIRLCFSLSNRLPRLLLFVACSGCFAVQAAPGSNTSNEASVILHSTITGNQEQPKVLYIVPWQPPGGVDQLQQPVQSLLNDVFAPVDRAEFQRELKYRAAADKAATDAAAIP
jgi:hypothetical protein